MSLYGDYLRERTGDQILEHPKGFATYRYADEKTVYIVDIYVIPEARRSKIASYFADLIVEKAKAIGCTRLIGSVVPSAKGSTDSLRALLAFGMKLDSCVPDFIVFSKEI